uniref:Protein kinase domain-containing protein n=1 Tax=Tetranychus urticae TaxID=32264 RepID=T1KKI7_TETUR
MSFHAKRNSNSSNEDGSDSSGQMPEVSSKDESGKRILCPLALRDRGYSILDQIGDIAVKIISLDKVPQLWKEKSLRKELKIIRHLQHPNIIRVWDIIKTRRSVYIFMEFAENNSILHFLQTTSKPIPEDDARLWISQTASALTYMHSKGIAHRDLKNENILLDRDNNAKLTDFGFACFTYDRITNQPASAPTCCGTLAYISPEVMTPPYDSKKADCWSFGVCIYEMLTNSRPFDESLSQPKFRLNQLDKKYTFPESIDLSPEGKDLIDKLLEPDPSVRYTAFQTISHPWVIKPFAFAFND